MNSDSKGPKGSPAQEPAIGPAQGGREVMLDGI